MRKVFYLCSTCVLAVLCLFLFTSCNALMSRNSNLLFKINDAETECSVSLKNKNAESVEIPSTANNVPVTTIGDFKNATKLKSVVLPDSITRISSNAFQGCSSLTSINIPDDATIGEYAFSGCTALKEITLPKNLEEVQKGLFYNCTSLERISIPKDVTNIVEDAFLGCTSLSTVTFNTTVLDYIGAAAFAMCSFENINIPSTVSYIGSGAFADNSNLKSVIIPNYVQKIKEQTFQKCTSLESVTIPSSVTKIESHAFYKCSSLTTCTYLGTTENWNMIVKSNSWNTLSAITKVTCSNGDVTI